MYVKVQENGQFNLRTGKLQTNMRKTGRGKSPASNNLILIIDVFEDKPTDTARRVVTNFIQL